MTAPVTSRHPRQVERVDLQCDMGSNFNHAEFASSEGIGTGEMPGLHAHDNIETPGAGTRADLAAVPGRPLGYITISEHPRRVTAPGVLHRPQRRAADLSAPCGSLRVGGAPCRSVQRVAATRSRLASAGAAEQVNASYTRTTPFGSPDPRRALCGSSTRRRLTGCCQTRET